MPDFEQEPAERSLRRLRDLASAGRAHAHPLPAEQVRVLGARRHRRRVVATVAAASVAVIVLAGGVVAATGDLVRPSTQPQPAATPEMSRAVLLRAERTVYQERGDFVAARTVHGEGNGLVSICQRDSLTSLGAVDVWRRDFAFRRGDDTVLRTAVMQFPDAKAARAAYETLGRWVGDCGDAVRSRGFTRFSDRARWYDVAVDDGTARFRSTMIYGPVEGDPHGELGYFDDEGLVRSRDRVMVSSLVVAGQDWNWAYRERDTKVTGLALNPMFGILEQAAHNMRD